MQTIYTNEGLISNSIKQSFPSAFSTYLSTFYNYNLNDTCQFGYANQPTNLTSKNYNLILINKYVIDCKNINSGLISKGLQTSIIFVVEENITKWALIFICNIFVRIKTLLAVKYL